MFTDTPVTGYTNQIKRFRMLCRITIDLLSEAIPERHISAAGYATVSLQFICVTDILTGSSIMRGEEDTVERLIDDSEHT